MDAFCLFGKRLESLARERFRTPTNIQKKAIPLVLEGKSMLLTSETGSGKTESVLLPVFDRFLRGEHAPISILYITPLKSLNRDMHKRLLWWGGKLDFDVAVRHGDTSQYERSMQAANPTDMLISTPETLQSLLVGKVMRTHLSHVKWVVIDEIHEIVGSKRGAQLSLGLERLRALAGNFQIIGLSATVGSPDRVASFLGQGFRILDAAQEKSTTLRVESPAAKAADRAAGVKLKLSPEAAARVRRIRDIIKKRVSLLVFTNTRESAEVLSSRLAVLEPTLPLETHHSSLAREVRIRAEQAFREQKLKALLCTSSLELGIDIGAIDCVLQFLSPRQVMKFLQRVGRSGHARGKMSEGIVIAGDADDCFESAVIAARALMRQIEETQICEKALDVLGHQIVGLALEQYDVPMEHVFALVKRAYPYRNLTEKEFFDVCLLMERLRVLWIAGGSRIAGSTMNERTGNSMKDFVLRRRRSAWTYYFQNLSTIPDVKTYTINDMYSGTPVGTLDAAFIALHGSPGQGIIVKGQAWRILDVGERVVVVEPMAGIEAAIPAWEGDLIPVPFAVAQDVGKLRSEIAGNLRRGDDAAGLLAGKLPVSLTAARKMVKAVKAQCSWGFLPTDRELLIEYDAERVIIHTCWGSLVNDTIGRVLSVLLTERLGSVGLRTDPYRIVLTTAELGWKEAAQTFMDLEPGKVENVLRESLPLTELFHWRFLHVAKRLGIIARNAEFGKGYLRKVMEAYRGTPAYQETFHEIYRDKLDIVKTLNVLKALRAEEFSVTIKEGISPFGQAALDRRFEIVPPERPEKEIFEMFKERLLGTTVGVVCCNCGKWASLMSVNNIPNDVVCPTCEARLIAVVPKRYVMEAQQLILRKCAGKRLTADEQKWLELTTDIAGLVMSRGKDAALALAGRGVGLRTAGRILAKMLEGDGLIREILSAERRYVKTRRFWQDR